MSIAENLAGIRNRIAETARSCGRDSASIKLIAVSKTKPIGDILEAVNAGQLAFGENYAQELRDKAKQVSEALPATSHQPPVTGFEWHYIGHLQKNKIKYVLPVASWIHTIDSVELLEEIVKKTNPPSPPFTKGGNSIFPPLKKGGRGGFSLINCLIEVNIAGESAKSGVSPENVFDLVDSFSTYAPFDSPSLAQGMLKHSDTYALALRGLMCMPPFSDNPETSRPYFKKLKNLLDEINSRSIYPEKLTELSMGMTQDFEVAIEEGATMVRIGSAIFGERQ